MTAAGPANAGVAIEALSHGYGEGERRLSIPEGISISTEPGRFIAVIGRAEPVSARTNGARGRRQACA